ncbi:MAG TPA: zf-HC2 domain-containing protein, partial [Urbifossiella sp.]
MMRCNDYQALILDHLYGLLDEAEAASVEAHLADCPACSAARSQAERAQGLFAQAAKSDFSHVKFTAPVEVYAQPKVGEHRFHGSSKKIAKRSWLGWAVAASVLLLIPGTLVPLGKLTNRYNTALREADAASIHMADARAVYEHTKNDTTHQTRIAAIQEKQKQAITDWLAAEAADRDRKVSVEVTKPLSALPGAPAEFAVAVADPMESLRGSRVEANVRDQAGTVLFTQKIDPKIPAAVRLPAAVWSKLAPQSELFLNVSAVNESNGSRTDLQEPIRLFGPVYATMLVTDKATYRPGEQLFFRSLTLERITFQPPSREQKLQFVLRKQDDPSKIVAVLTGSTCLVKETEGGVETVTDHNGKPIRGVGCGAFVLPANLADGEYTLTLTELPGPGGTPTAITFPVNRTIKVRSGAPERFAKKITFSAPSYAPGPGQKATAFAELKLGDKPVAGAKVNAVIIADDRPVDIVTYMPLAIGKDGKTTPITDKDGRCRIEFPMPLLANLPRGNVKLMVSFTHDGVEESVAERVPITGKEIIVEFFPEGGKLVAGVPNRVYIRGTTPTGKPVDIRGTVAAGAEIIAKVEAPTHGEPTAPGGLGSFTFTPKAGTVYRLRLPNINPAGLAPMFELPKAEADGVVIAALDAVTRPGQPIVIRIHSVGKDRKLVVGAYTRGRLADTQKLTAKAGQPTLATLVANSDARGGVTRITVFEEPADASGELIPVAERLVFRKPGELLNLSVSAGSTGTAFAPGSPIDLSIAATDEKGQGVPAILWAAAVNTAVAPDARNRSLPTHFLLAGEVQTPDDLEYADFLLTEHPKAAEALDHVLATQGWRRFVEQGRVPARSGSPVAELLKLHGQFVPVAKQ